MNNIKWEEVKWKAFDYKVMKYVSPTFKEQKDLCKYINKHYKRSYIEKYISFSKCLFDFNL